MGRVIPASKGPNMMKIGDRLIGQIGLLRIILEVKEDHVDVVIWDVSAKDPIGKVIATAEPGIDENFALAKEQAILLIAREHNAHSDEEFDRIRRDIAWKR